MRNCGIRVRYAPSPTGNPHMGNIRTAIFNWLLARSTGGSFIIRIEDTDQSRKVNEATEMVMKALRWLKLDWDEGPDVGGKYGPYIQSERLSLYNKSIGTLLDNNNAYHCYCTPERLDSMRKNQKRLNQSIGYDGLCRNLTQKDHQAKKKQPVKSVVRFAMPQEGNTIVNDLIRGSVTFKNNLIDDFVILKSDGFPTYHLANVVDDNSMGITHVLRGEEWLSSTPRHLSLYKSLGLKPPIFAHLPMILGSDKSKLSKRHGAISVLNYRQDGYLPQAIVNFLVLLGWSLDDSTDVFSKEELLESFSINRVTKPGAIFNIEKLNWLNGYHIRQISHEKLADAILDYWHHFPPVEIPKQPDRGLILKIIPLIQDRLKTLKDVCVLFPFFFTTQLEYEVSELIPKDLNAKTTKEALEKTLSIISKIRDFNAESIESVMRKTANDLDLTRSQLFSALRVAITGQRISPPLFQTMQVLGKERSLVSLREAIDKLIEPRT